MKPSRPAKQNATERSISVLSLVLIIAAGVWTVVDPGKWGLLSVVNFAMALNFVALFSYARRLGQPWAVPYFAFLVMILMALLQLFFVAQDHSLVWLKTLVVVLMLVTVTLSLVIWRYLRVSRPNEHPVAPSS